MGRFLTKGEPEYLLKASYSVLLVHEIKQQASIDNVSKNKLNCFLYDTCSYPESLMLL